eukprot:scaffold71750_cov45-Phaeocystis_antarctica.AAC.1
MWHLGLQPGPRRVAAWPLGVAASTAKGCRLAAVGAALRTLAQVAPAQREEFKLAAAWSGVWVRVKVRGQG